MSIKSITWNYSPAYSNGGVFFAESYKEATVGEGNVVGITVHASQGEGDKWFWDIHYKNGEVITVFNPNTITSN